jgi:hypothetical protein
MLTAEQKQYQQQIKESLTQLLIAKRHHIKLISECDHVANISSNDNVIDCIICNEPLGWKCPDSPDHVCHYDVVTLNNQLGVYLINHKFYPLTGLQILEYNEYDEEICIFCHIYKERK